MTPQEMYMTLELIGDMEEVTRAGNQYAAIMLTEAEIDMEARAYLAGDRSKFAVVSAYWTAAMNELDTTSRLADAEWSSAVRADDQKAWDAATAKWQVNEARREDLAKTTGLNRYRSNG